jgi:formate hydrogenlyase transcriptional activator
MASRPPPPGCARTRAPPGWRWRTGGPELVLPPLPSAVGFSGVPAGGPADGGPGRFDDEVRSVIERALRRAGGRVYGPGGAADLLGLRPTTLQGKIRKYGISG